MSDLEWTFEMEGSWSLNREPIYFEVPIEVVEATSADIVPAIVVQSQGPVDPKEDPSQTLQKSFRGSPKRKYQGIPKGTSFSSLSGPRSENRIWKDFTRSSKSSQSSS